MTVTWRRSMAAVAVAGALTAGCASTPPMVQPVTDVPTAPSSDAPAEPTSVDEEPSEGAGSQASETAGGAGQAAELVTPAADFDPCSVLSAADVSDAIGIDVPQGESHEVMGTYQCRFTDSEDSGVSVQWVPFTGGFDGALTVLEDTFDVTGDMEPVDIAGAGDAVRVPIAFGPAIGEVVYARVQGGYFQVMTLTETGPTDAVPVTTLTLERVP